MLLQQQSLVQRPEKLVKNIAIFVLFSVNLAKQNIRGIAIIPCSNVAISNQLTRKTGWQELEENHLNFLPRHGSLVAEGGQGWWSG